MDLNNNSPYFPLSIFHNVASELLFLSQYWYYFLFLSPALFGIVFIF